MSLYTLKHRVLYDMPECIPEFQFFTPKNDDAYEKIKK